MDISNRALAMFLLAAIAVSLVGTVISLNRLDSVKLTGLAQSDVGTVQLEVLAGASITTQDNNAIDFGQCNLGSGVPVTINSEDLVNTSTSCGTFNADNISVRNNGNIDLNVTINTTGCGDAHCTGTDIFVDSDSDSSAFAYKIVNGGGITGYAGGCTTSGGFPWQENYTNFTTVSQRWLACSNLTKGPTANSFVTHFQLVVPSDATPGSDSVTLTYFGHQII